MSPAISEKEREALTTYDRGFIDGMWQYAWWKDGVSYVGSTGTTYAQAVDRFLRENGYRADSFPAKRRLTPEAEKQWREMVDPYLEPNEAMRQEGA